MKCGPCADAALNADTASVNAACVHCRVREIARGPDFAASRQSNAMTPAYRALLRIEFGESANAIKTGNDRVKAAWPAIEKARASR